MTSRCQETQSILSLDIPHMWRMKRYSLVKLKNTLRENKVHVKLFTWENVIHERLVWGGLSFDWQWQTLSFYTRRLGKQLDFSCCFLLRHFAGWDPIHANWLCCELQVEPHIKCKQLHRALAPSFVIIGSDFVVALEKRVRPQNFKNLSRKASLLAPRSIRSALTSSQAALRLSSPA